MAHLAVAYDKGAATPREIVSGLSNLGSVTFLVSDSEHAQSLKPWIQELGHVVELGVNGRVDLDNLHRLKIDALLTFSEPMMVATASVASALGLSFHSQQTTRLLTAKSAQRERLRQHKLDSVRTRTLTCPEDWASVVKQVGLPAVIKPNRGYSSGDTVLVDDPQSGQLFVEEWFAKEPSRRGESLVVEEFLKGRNLELVGDYVSVESVISHGKVSTFAVTGKFPLVDPFRETGGFWPCALSVSEQREVAELARNALHALGVESGIAHTEVKLTPDGPRIIEVNGRLGAHINELSRRASGGDLVEVAGRLALGEHIECSPLNLERVYFEYRNPAPPFACRLQEVHGSHAVRAEPGIITYRPYVHTGASIIGGVMTNPLDHMFGSADDHDSMFRTLNSALSHLEFTFSSPSGQISMSPRELTHVVHELPRASR